MEVTWLHTYYASLKHVCSFQFAGIRMRVKKVDTLAYIVETYFYVMSILEVG